MTDISTGSLIGILVVMIILSGCFSGSETGLLSFNRYRLRHLVKAKHRGAMRVSRLLSKPDRLISLILLGNNFVNIAASFIASEITLRIAGDQYLATAAGLLTLVILICSEVTPKTIAVIHPERFAYPAAFVYEPLLKVLYYPLVWPITIISNNVLKLFGVRFTRAMTEKISSEELRSVLTEASAIIPGSHQLMLTNILDLEKVTVDDIMIPRHEIVGLDLDAEWDDILRQLSRIQHTRLPVYNTDINKVSGIVHLRNVLGLMNNKEFNKASFLKIVREPYFVPQGTPLHTQLLNFQRQKRRIALIVNEYGELQGLATLEDILEEIVGEFTSDPAQLIKEVHSQEDGSFFVDGSTNIREVNRTMNWNLPTHGPKTLSGLIIEYLEDIPEAGTSLRIAEFTLEIIQVKGNTVKIARVVPPVTTTIAEAP